MSDRNDVLDGYMEYKICCGDDDGTSSEGCYIATAVYGSYDCPEVWVLRRFRDQSLRSSAIGTFLVKVYYALSPHLVRRFGHIDRLKRMTKIILDAFVRRLKAHGFEDTAYCGR